jgi:hypothetical protein
MRWSVWGRWPCLGLAAAHAGERERASGVAAGDCSAQVGRLWTSLAEYYIRRTMYEKARDVYEEGLCSVVTVHDFSLIYDAYTQASRAAPRERALPWAAHLRLHGIAESPNPAEPAQGRRHRCRHCRPRARLSLRHAAHWGLRCPRPLPYSILSRQPPLLSRACPLLLVAVQFEESLLSAKMALLADEGEEPGADEPAEGDVGTDFLLKDDGSDLDLRWGRGEAGKEGGRL